MSQAATPARRSAVKVIALAAVAALALGAFVASAGGRTFEAPRNNGAPTVSDTAGLPLTAVKPGDTIQGNNGSWFCTPPYPGLTTCKYDFQWQRCNSGGGSCVDIAGATNQKYVVTQADAGGRLRVAVIATNRDCNATNTECRFVSVGAFSGQTPVVATPTAPPVVVAKPTATAAPAIAGLASEREVLTVSDGGWTGPAPITTARQWTRCDAAGANCSHISGATAPTYTVTTEDVGHTLRVVVTASNAGGSSTATSSQTAVVTPLAPRPGRNTLTVSDVSLPQRLVIDRLGFSTNPLRSHAAFTARFRIKDTRGFLIGGALVQVVGVPFGLIRSAPEVETEPNGWATLTLEPTARLKLRNGGSLVLFVRARKPGENALAGVSTRRLVRVRLAAPAVPGA
jgi:hypothetical protein